MTSRRAFVGGLLGIGAGALSASCAARPATHDASNAKNAGTVARPRPRYLVILFLTGGFDTVLSFYGLDQDAVGDGIDCCYRASERRLGQRRFYGPCIGDLFRHEADLALIHGVRTDTVSHQDGAQMVVTGNRFYSGGTAPFADRVCQKLPGDAPVATAVFLPEQPFKAAMFAFDDALVFDGFTLANYMSPDAPPLDVPAWYETLAKVQQDYAGVIEQGLADDYRRGVRSGVLAKRWLELARAAPQMKEPNFGPGLRMTLAGLRHNLAKCFVTATKMDWFDSHADNERRQRRRLTSTLGDLATFIDALKSERNEFGPLFDQTTILLGSELGRYPKLNPLLGKDHWPENTWVMLGAGVKRGVTVGGSDLRFRALPVDFASGATNGPNARSMYIDSVFATAARIVTGDATQCGYKRSDVLDCVLA